MKIHHEYSFENSFGNIFLKKPPKKSFVMKILAPRNPMNCSVCKNSKIKGFGG